MQNIRDLVARQLPAKNQASLASVSKDWQRAAQPHLDTRRALIRVADVRRRKAIERFVRLCNVGMDFVGKIESGQVPQIAIHNDDWYLLKRDNMGLFITRHVQQPAARIKLLEVQAPRLGVVLEMWVFRDSFRVYIRHATDSADTARAVADAWGHFPARLELDPTLYARRPRRGNPRAY